MKGSSLMFKRLSANHYYVLLGIAMRLAPSVVHLSKVFDLLDLMILFFLSSFYDHYSSLHSQLLTRSGHPLPLTIIQGVG
jgi:hypothetical protein